MTVDGMNSNSHKTSNERSAEALAASTWAIRAIHEATGTAGTIDERLQRNNEIARNVMREEIGEYGPYAGSYYDLDDATRAILLAHGRQDAAHTVVNSVELLKRLDRVERVQRRLIWLIPLVTVFMAAIGVWIMVVLQ